MKFNFIIECLEKKFKLVNHNFNLYIQKKILIVYFLMNIVGIIF